VANFIIDWIWDIDYYLSFHFYMIFLIKDSNRKMWNSSHVSHGEWKYEGYKLAEPNWNGDHLFLGRWFNKFKSLISYLNPYKK